MYFCYFLVFGKFLKIFKFVKNIVLFKCYYYIKYIIYLYNKVCLLFIVGIDGKGCRVFKICVYGIFDLRIDGVRVYIWLFGFYLFEKICYLVKI